MKLTLFRRNWLSLALALLLLLLLSASAWADTPVFAIDADDGKVGEEISVSVVVKQNPGMKQAVFGLLYDQAYLLPLSYQAGAGLGGMTGGSVKNYHSDGAPMVSFSYINTTAVSGERELCSIRFRILALPPGGSSSLSLVQYENNSWFRDSSGNVLEPTLDCSDAVKVSGGGGTVNVSSVKLNKNQLQLDWQGSETLLATVSPANATNPLVNWSSSDASVVTVKDGLLSAQGAGTAVITATTVDAGKTASCSVTVSVPPQTAPLTVAVSGVLLDKSQLELDPGEEVKLVATVTPANAGNSALRWSSDDRSVARVFSDGRVQAQAGGSATVSVTTLDGGFSDSCKVTVSGDSLALAPGLDNFSLADKGFPFADVSVVAGNWIYESVNKVYQLGLMQGVSAAAFSPQGDYRVCEALMTVARLHNIYNGGDGLIGSSGTVWYDEAVRYCLEQGIIKVNDFNDYQRNITRAEMAYVFAHGLPASELSSINSISVLPDVQPGDSYATEILLLYNAGVLRGNDPFGTFAPQSEITRCEAAAIISRMALSEQRVPFLPQAQP